MIVPIIIIFGLFLFYLIAEFFSPEKDVTFMLRTMIVVVITSVAIVTTMLLFEYREKADGICPTYEQVQQPLYKKIQP